MPSDLSDHPGPGRGERADGEGGLEPTAAKCGLLVRVGEVEASAARDYALQSGIPAQDILIEEKSHTTYENVLYAKKVADTHAIRKVLIVSDPLHMKRAVLMAQDVGLIAEPSPTPSTRYQGFKSQVGLLAHETHYYIGYLLRRPFLNN